MGAASSLPPFQRSTMSRGGWAALSPTAWKAPMPRARVWYSSKIWTSTPRGSAASFMD